MAGSLRAKRRPALLPCTLPLKNEEITGPAEIVEAASSNSGTPTSSAGCNFDEETNKGKQALWLPFH